MFGLLTAFAFIEFIISIWISVLCCGALCRCCKTRVTPTVRHLHIHILFIPTWESITITCVWIMGTFLTLNRHMAIYVWFLERISHLDLPEFWWLLLIRQSMHSVYTTRILFRSSYRYRWYIDGTSLRVAMLYILSLIIIFCPKLPDIRSYPINRNEVTT